MSATDEDDRPALKDLVDVLLDSATEPVVATVTQVAEGVVLLDAPVDHQRRLALPPLGEGGLMVWRGARDVQQATDVGLAFTGMTIADADRMRRFVFDQLRLQRSRSSS